MRKLFRVGLLMSTAITMAACMGHGTRYNQQYYWKHAQVISPVVVPSDIHVKPALGMYPAPPIAVSGSNTQPSLVPPGSQIAYYQQVLSSKKRSSLK